MSSVTDPLFNDHRPHHGWLRPALAGCVALVLLGGLAYGVNTAIERYHDRMALRGLNGKPKPVQLTVAGEPMTIPANMIRFREERRGGAVEKVDLLFHWPSLDGFSAERSEEFRSSDESAPLVFVTISARETRLDSSTRLDSIYRGFFEGPETEGPAGLYGRSLGAESGYGDETVFYTKHYTPPFVTRCVDEGTPEIPATCIRDVNIGQGLSMLYRFNKKFLGDWRTLDDRLLRLTAQFFRKQ